MEIFLLLCESCLGYINASRFCTDGGHGQADEKDAKRTNAKSEWARLKILILPEGPQPVFRM